jgi:DNA processing protein
MSFPPVSLIRDNRDERDKRFWSPSRLGWLGCAWFEAFGPKSQTKLHAAFGEDGGDKLWRADVGELVAAGVTEKSAAEFCVWRADKSLADLAARVDGCGADFLLPWDKDFPAPLRHLPDVPGSLFRRGATSDARPWIAVVGTRAMTAYGKRATEIITRELVERGAGIVSGLALGVDACAHEAALDAHGATVAVLGSGIDPDSVYPRANLKLSERILAAGGALVGEYPPGTESLRFHFPLRNRLIAGLSRATVVIEAGADSGSVLTAKLALEQGRDVFAVPGPITSETSRGTHELLRQGAQICTGGADVLDSPSMAADATPTVERRLSKTESRILDACRTAMQADDLCRALDMAPAALGADCMALELMGALQDLGGQTYELTSYGRRLMGH